MNDLLKKYMALILQAEGVSYVEWATHPDFTKEEIETLQRIEQEIISSAAAPRER